MSDQQDIIIKCKPSNNGNVGRAIQCLSKRISHLEKILDSTIVNFDKSIQQETNTRTTVDTEIQNTVEHNNQVVHERIDQTESNVNQAIEQETSRASENSDFLNSKIDKEIQDRITDVDAEEARAKAVEQALSNAITNENSRATYTEQVLSNNLYAEEQRARSAEQGLQNAINNLSNSTGNTASGLAQDINTEEYRAKQAEQTNANGIAAINEKIPPAASKDNQLADKQFVANSISTASATYHGSKNVVTDLSLSIATSHANIEEALRTAFAGRVIDNNDFCFVQIPTSNEIPTEIAITERYRFNGTSWNFEYVLNTSGFTNDQWNALNSGITVSILNNILERLTAIEQALGGIKLQKITSQAYEELQEKDSNTLYIFND